VLAHGEVLREQAARIVAGREELARALAALPGLACFPSAANFLLVRVPDGPATFEALKARGILVRTFHGSHPLLAHCLRLTVGTADENAKLLGALASILRSHA
jgi:histidinol-phosphate aminotransferase